MDDAIVQLLHGVDFSAGTHARERTRQYLDLAQHDRPIRVETYEDDGRPLSDDRLGMLAAAGNPYETPAQLRSLP